VQCRRLRLCHHSPVAGTEVPEAQSLLRGQVDHDEAVGAGLLCVLEHLLLAVAQQRVVVSHEHDGGLEAALPRITDHLQDIGGVDAVLQGLLLTCRQTVAGIREWMSQRTVLAVWMVGPSAMGSVKGIPNSMMSAHVK
jgi:hypothetical protein